MNGAESRVDYAGLVPYYSGLYQLNVRTPFWNVPAPRIGVAADHAPSKRCT